MGLTIHYTLTARLRSAMRVLDRVQMLWHEAKQLPFKDVSSLRHVYGDGVRRASEDPEWRWLMIQAGASVPDSDRKGCSYTVPPTEVIAFRTSPGEGCEDANFGLAKYPKTLISRDGSHFLTRLSGWSGRSFCKTQYAADPRRGGVLNFVRCHLAVIALLDAARRIGFTVEVTDEGGYWQKRDVKALAQEVGRWDQFIAAFGGALKDAGDKTGVKLVAPVLGRPDFERLEAEGSIDPGIADVVRLMDLTAPSLPRCEPN